MVVRAVTVTHTKSAVNWDSASAVEARQEAIVAMRINVCIAGK